MKKFTIALTGALLIAGTAHATQPVFQFKSTVKSIEHWVDIERPVTLSSVALPSGFVSVNDAVIGTLSYDIRSTGTVSDSGGTNYAPAATTFRIGAGMVVGGGRPNGGITWVYDNDRFPFGDALTSFSYFYSNNWQVSEGLGVALEDPSGTVLSGHQLPGAELTGFTSGEFSYTYETWIPDASGNHYHRWDLKGDITAIAAVPEPGTYAMLLAGLVIVGWRRRARG